MVTIHDLYPLVSTDTGPTVTKHYSAVTHLESQNDKHIRYKTGVDRGINLLLLTGDSLLHTRYTVCGNVLK